MEEYNRAYKNRCRKQLEAWGAPLSDWTCVEVRDAMLEGGELHTCELCGCLNVRYIHVMRHHEYPRDVLVGCICAGVMDGDILAAKERDRQMQNRAKRRRNYLKRTWKWASNGDRILRYKNNWITIALFKDGFAVLGDAGRRWGFRDFPSAVSAAFDLVDPPIFTPRKENFLK